MDQKEILSRVEHTLLTPTATWEQVKAVCDEGRELGTAAVCIPPRYVKRAAAYVSSPSQSPALARPWFITMSISSAPLRMASSVSKTFTSGVE